MINNYFRSIWFVVFFFIFVAAENVSNQTDCSETYCCKTRDCFISNIKYNVNLLKNMNITVKPCDNFYEYACGNFDNILNVPKTTNHMAHASNMMSKLDSLVMSSNSSNSLKPFNFIRYFKDSCENLNRNNNYSIVGIKEDKLDYLKSVISKLGGWPVVEGDKWNETNFDWIEFLNKANEIGYNMMRIFTSFNVKKGLAPTLNLPIGLLLNSTSVSQNNVTKTAYQNYMVNTAKFFKAKEDTVVDLLDVLEFELKLMDAKENSVLPANITITNSMMSLEEMNLIWPSINWTRLFESKFHSYVSSRELIYIENKNFINKFEKLMNETSKRVQANYGIWKIIEYSAPIVNSVTLYNFAQTYYALTNQGFIGFQNCQQMTKTMLSDVIKALYGRTYPVDQKIKNHANIIFSNIKNKFIDFLNSSKVNGEHIKKIETVKLFFGNTDELMDDNNLKKYFKGLDITPDNLLANYLNIYRFRNNKEYSLVRKPSDSYNWEDIFASTVLDLVIKIRPYSYPLENIIEIPSGFLEGFFISPDRYNYTNYAVFGVLIGIKFEYLINMISINNYGERAYPIEQCLTEQYTILGENLTKNILKERIGHQRALEVAYSAYRELIKDKQEPDLAGLYSSDQAFWLSFSNLYCSPKWWDISFGMMQNFGEKLVTTSLSNIPEFSKAFSCPLGSKMNPIKKCPLF